MTDTTKPFVTVQLDVPLQRGDTEITEIQLRRPKAGELRGLALADVMRMDVETLQKVLPRISQPILTGHEINQLDSADLATLAAEVSLFLASKADRSRVSLTA